MTDTIDPNRGKIGGMVREHIRQLEAALATSEAARVKAEAALRGVRIELKRPDHELTTMQTAIASAVSTIDAALGETP